MSGWIDETNYSDVKEKYLSTQSSLASWSDSSTTHIAVTSLPRGSMEEYVDEVLFELGMPECVLRRFLQRRAEYKTNSAVENAHEKAYEDTHTFEAFTRAISTNQKRHRRLYTIL